MAQPDRSENRESKDPWHPADAPGAPVDRGAPAAPTPAPHGAGQNPKGAAALFHGQYDGAPAHAHAAQAPAPAPAPEGPKPFAVHRLDDDGLSLGRGKKRDEVELHGAGGTERTSSASAAVELGGGARVAASRESRREDFDAEGKTVRAHEEKSSAKGGVVWEDGKLGVGASASKRKETSAGGVTRARERDVSASVTDEGVAVDGKLGKEIEKGGVKRTFSLGGGLGMDVDVKPIPGQVPLAYTVTTTLHAGLRLGGGAGAEDELDEEAHHLKSENKAERRLKGKGADEHKEEEPKMGT